MSRLRRAIFILAVLSIFSPVALAWLTYSRIPGRFVSPGGVAGVMNYVYDAAAEPGGLCPAAAGCAVEIAAAHSTWNDDRGSSLALGQTLGSCDCTNSMDLINCVAFDGPGAAGALAATSIVTAGPGNLREFDVCIDPTILADLESVVLHEFGHALGLDHTDAVPAALIDVPQVRRNGQRPPIDYIKSIMLHFISAGEVKRTLPCDDKAGANFLYPPAGVPIEPRVYRVGNSGGCDFGDAPDPLLGFDFGEYPSLENGEDTIINGVQDIDLDNEPMGNFPGPEDIDIDGNGVFGFDEDVNVIGLFPELSNGARHKDSRMEWLGPIDLVFDTGIQSPIPQPILNQPPTFLPKNLVIPAPPDGFIPFFPGSVIAGQTGDPGPAARPASATFETDARIENRDELDDGVSQRGPLVGGVSTTIDILVNTNGRAPGRYDALDPDKRLYLNGWSDWNGDGDWKDWDAPIAGGVVLVGPGGTPPCILPAPSDDYMVHWEGTPAVDQLVSPNFCGGTPAGPNARYLTFLVTPPAGTWEGEVYQRFRLDYGEDVGQNLRDFSDPSLVIVDGNSATAVTPGDRNGTIGFEQGEAKYGEVEDYRPDEPDLFFGSIAEVDIRFPAGEPDPHVIQLEGPAWVVVDLASLDDTDFDTREQVTTEMVRLELTGFDPDYGNIAVRVRSPELPPFQRSMGEIEEDSQENIGLLDLPPFVVSPTDLSAFSFFDLYLEIELIDLGVILHNEVPKHMTSTIHHKPPIPGDVYESPVFIDLFDPLGQLVAALGPGYHEPDPCGNGTVDFSEQCDDGNTVSGDGCSACNIDYIQVITGVAGGGTINLVINGVSIQVTTNPGDTAEQVAAAIADAINDDPTLTALQVFALPFDNEVAITGIVTSFQSNDPGIETSVRQTFKLVPLEQPGRDSAVRISGGCELDFRAEPAPDRYMDAGERLTLEVGIESRVDLGNLTATLTTPNSTSLTISDSPATIPEIHAGVPTAVPFRIAVDPNLVGTEKVEVLLTISSPGQQDTVLTFIQVLNADEESLLYSTDFPLGGGENIDLSQDEILTNPVNDPTRPDIDGRDELVVWSSLLDGRDENDLPITVNDHLQAPWNFDNGDGGFRSGLRSDTAVDSINDNIAQWGEDQNFNGILDGYCTADPDIVCTRFPFANNCPQDPAPPSHYDHYPTDGIPDCPPLTRCCYSQEDRDPLNIPPILDQNWSTDGGCGWQTRAPGTCDNPVDPTFDGLGCYPGPDVTAQCGQDGTCDTGSPQNTGGIWHTGGIGDPSHQDCLVQGNDPGQCQGYETVSGYGDEKWVELLVTPVVSKVNKQRDGDGDPVYTVEIFDFSFNMAIDLADHLAEVMWEVDPDVNDHTATTLYDDAVSLTSFSGPFGLRNSNFSADSSGPPSEVPPGSGVPPGGDLPAFAPIARCELSLTPCATADDCFLFEECIALFPHTSINGSDPDGNNRIGKNACYFEELPPWAEQNLQAIGLAGPPDNDRNDDAFVCDADTSVVCRGTGVGENQACLDAGLFPTGCGPSGDTTIDEFVTLNGPIRNVNLSSFGGPDLRNVILEDVAGPSGDAFQAAIGFGVRRRLEEDDQSGIVSYGVGVDDAVFRWREYRLVADQTTCPVCVDNDNDGYGEFGGPACPHPGEVDCDDQDSTNSPGNPEICDNKDNNCDQIVDEYFSQCGLGECASTGFCSAGVDSCIPGSPSAESCDGLDNDCDGTVDDFATACGVGECGSSGLCSAGSDSCAPGSPSAESCDGLDNDCDGDTDDDLSAVAELCNQLDDNCNGLVDEGNPEGGALCDSGLPGLCMAGTEFCDLATGSLTCIQDEGGIPEVCSNSVDDDCDGDVDEPGDADGDLIDNCSDNCPIISNFSQDDDDFDGIGNACDPTPNGRGAERAVGNVTNLFWPGPFKDTMRWDAVPGAVYNVYRGYFTSGNPKVYNHQCFVSAVGGAVTTEFAEPRPFTYFYYLVSAETNGEEGSLGDGDSPPVPRPFVENLGCPYAVLDRDVDGVKDAFDNCPPDPGMICNTTNNPIQVGNVQGDTDFDAHGDICDNCPTVFNLGQENFDAATEPTCEDDLTCLDPTSAACQGGDVCDPDQDGDGILEDDGDGSADPCTGGNAIDCDDNCPLVTNPLQEDGDGDGIGDACDV